MDNTMNVCEICGDTGKPEDLVRCEGCGSTIQHWYCFRVLVGKSREALLAWRCEDCVEKNTNKNQIESPESSREEGEQDA